MRNRRLAVSVTLISVLALTGCGGGSSTGQSGDGTAAREPGSARDDSGDTSRNGSGDRASGEMDEEPAVAIYRKYRAALDEMTRSGGETTTRLSGVAVGKVLRDSTEQAELFRQEKFRTTGNTRLVWVKRIDSNSTSVFVRGCYDTTDTKTLDSAGKSTVRADAPTRWQEDAEVRLVKGRWWRVATSRVRAYDC